MSFWCIVRDCKRILYTLFNRCLSNLIVVQSSSNIIVQSMIAVKEAPQQIVAICNRSFRKSVAIVNKKGMQQLIGSWGLE